MKPEKRVGATPRRYDEAFKREAVRLWQSSGRSAETVARELGLSQPSWWTQRRALAAVGFFALCAALGIGSVLTLRRRVRRQTAQIRA